MQNIIMASSTIGRNAPSSPSSPCKSLITPNSDSIVLCVCCLCCLCCRKIREDLCACGKAWKTSKTSGKGEPRRTLLSQSHVNLPVICTTHPLQLFSFLTDTITFFHPYPLSPTQFSPKLATVSTQLEHGVQHAQRNARAETRTTAKSYSPQFPSIHAARKERQHEQPSNDQRR